MQATRLIRWCYTRCAKPIFFRFDPESVHDNIIKTGVFLGRFKLTRALTHSLFCYEDTSLEQTILGIHFKNPIGLTAGFDKNAELTNIIPSVGFGFAEIGSVTGEPCEGNPKPRLWRLPKSQGLVVYYGLKNDGAEVIAKRLRNKKFEIPIGVSVAKTNNEKTVDVSAGIADYEKAYRAFTNIGAYITVNISCPNAFGGEPFTSPEKLETLLSHLDQVSSTKPVFIKMPADLSPQETDALLDVAKTHRVQGVIIANLTKNRNNPQIIQKEIEGITKGGISGKPMYDIANNMISYVYKNYKDRFIIIGSGGVFTAEDAYEKIRRGASLIQLATGMIFGGPQTIGEINQGLVKLLKQDGYKNVSEAVGAANR